MLKIEKMSSVEVKEWAKNILKKHKKDYFSEDLYFFENLSKMKEKTSLDVILKNNKIFDIFFVDFYYDTQTITPHWFSDLNMEELSFLFENYPNAYIDLGEYSSLDLSNTDIIQVNFHNDVYNRNYYTHSSLNLVTKKGNENKMKESFEKTFFVNCFDINNIELKLLTSSEISNLIYDKRDYIFEVPKWSKKYQNTSFCGFNIFSDGNISDAKYLTALYNGTIVGIIKCGLYGNGKDYRQSINYIDIRCDFKNHGLATKMIKEINLYLEPNLPLVITDETEEGKKCKILDLFKNNIKNINVFSYNDFFEYIHYNK